MTPAAAAAVIDGGEYGNEIGKEFEAVLKQAGLVAVFGASDDLMELRGAVHDEAGAWNGGESYFTPDGLLTNECEHDTCPYFEKEKAKAQLVTALWDSRGFSWTYETEIPHVKFVIKEDGENYCEGIVFALAAVKPAAEPAKISVNDYVSEYEYRGDADYKPTEHEQAMIEDAIEGYLSESALPR